MTRGPLGLMPVPVSVTLTVAYAKNADKYIRTAKG
jgi:hypothetical protein